MGQTQEIISCSSLGQVLEEQSLQKRKAGRPKFKETRHPVFKGVRKRKGKRVSVVREPSKKTRTRLRTFPSPGMAANAYDAAALALKADSASLNFPESAYALPRASSSSVRDNQIAAIEAAGTFIDNASASGSSAPALQSLEDDAQGSSSNLETIFMDEEEAYNMPGLLESMAEGLMITPPSMQKGCCPEDHDANDYVECNLWGYL